MTDLFVSAKDALFREITQRKVMKTSDVIRWGVANFSNRAERNMRQLAREGRVRRMAEAEKRKHYGKTKEDVWEFITVAQAINQ